MIKYDFTTELMSLRPYSPIHLLVDEKLIQSE